MPFTTLISTDMLSARLSDTNLVVIDCRYKLDDEAWGAREYAAGHIPGAVYASLDRDLSGQNTGSHSRRGESFLPVESRRARHVPFSRRFARAAAAIDRRCAGGSSRVLLRIGRDRVSQPARARACRSHRRKAVFRFVERMVF